MHAFKCNTNSGEGNKSTSRRHRLEDKIRTKVESEVIQHCNKYIDLTKTKSTKIILQIMLTFVFFTIQTAHNMSNWSYVNSKLCFRLICLYKNYSLTLRKLLVQHCYSVVLPIINILY